MFTIHGGRHGYCDGLSRRSFLKVGAMGVGGLTLADMFRMEAQAGVTGSHKAVINIFLGGGPSHQDMWDLKPQAPVEFRGEFNPISTNVPGMQICEHMPNLAKMADKFAIVRSLVGTVDDHNSYHTQAGYPQRDFKSIGGFPALGSVVARLKGSIDDPAPSFVSFMGNISPGFLGPIYSPYRPDGPGRQNLSLNGQMTADRLHSRTKLLAELDRMKRDMDRTGAMQALDAFSQRAVGVITSGKLADALNLDKEDPAIRKRYTEGFNNRRGETERFLMARRVIEAGVRCVSLNWGGWDTHSNNFQSLKDMLPSLDKGLAALIQDLYERSMLNDTTIVMWGEFGRTPRVNGNAGRDHWSRVMSVFLAGGGMKTGQVIGATDRTASEAKDRPVHLREVFATLYHNMGIDAKNTTIIDPMGRPQYLVDARDPIHELI